jgi:hypothetical protein
MLAAFSARTGGPEAGGAEPSAERRAGDAHIGRRGDVTLRYPVPVPHELQPQLASLDVSIRRRPCPICGLPAIVTDWRPRLEWIVVEDCSCGGFFLWTGLPQDRLANLSAADRDDLAARIRKFRAMGHEVWGATTDGTPHGPLVVRTARPDWPMPMPDHYLPSNATRLLLSRELVATSRDLIARIQATQDLAAIVRQESRDACERARQSRARRAARRNRTPVRRGPTAGAGRPEIDV